MFSKKICHFSFLIKNTTIEKDFLILFGKNIKFLREQKGLTYMEFSAATGLDDAFIRRVERGQNITIKTLVTIAKGLDIPPENLFKFSSQT